VSWIYTLWDRPPIRKTLYAMSAVVLILGLIVYTNNRSHGDAAPAEVVPGGPSPAEVAYGSPIPLPKEATDVAKRFIHGAVLRDDLSASWDESTKAVHGGLTRAQWQTGAIPVPPFPSDAFAGIKYKVEHSRQRSVMLLVSVGSIKSDVRFQEFFIEMVPSGDAWKVNYIGPRGTSPPVPTSR
jgi:hypothetical protein